MKTMIWELLYGLDTNISVNPLQVQVVREMSIGTLLVVANKDYMIHRPYAEVLAEWKDALAHAVIMQEAK